MFTSGLIIYWLKFLQLFILRKRLKDIIDIKTYFFNNNYNNFFSFLKYKKKSNIINNNKLINNGWDS